MKNILILLCLSLTLLLPATQHADVAGEIVFTHPIKPRELWTTRLRGTLNTYMIYAHNPEPNFRIIGIAPQIGGNYIAFLARSGDEAAGINIYNIYVLDKTKHGEQARNLTQDRFGFIFERGFDISINGDIIFSSSATPRSTHGMYLIRQNEFQLARPVPELLVKDASEPTWFPDGKRIAFSKNHVTSILTVATGKVMELEGVGRLPAISPDGKYIARVFTLFGMTIALEVNSLSPQKFVVRKFLDHGDAFMDFKWTPDGEQIAYTSLFTGRRHYVIDFNRDKKNLGNPIEFLEKDIFGHHVTLYDWMFTGAYPVEPTQKHLTTLWGKLKR